MSATLKVILVSTKVILATEYIISGTLKAISATTKANHPLVLLLEDNLKYLLNIQPISLASVALRPS